MFKVKEDFHEGSPSGHFGMNTILRLLVAHMHKDVAELCQNCDICQCLEPI